MSNFHLLSNWGWQPFFQQQLALDDWDSCIAARIINQHRNEIVLATGTATIPMPLTPSLPSMVVGDWILLDHNQRLVRLLDRKTQFVRKASGTKVSTQLIAANVDTVFIVCSMNADFNLSRIERFLALVNEAGAEPVIVLSKRDQTDIPDRFVSQVQALDPLLSVEAINGLDIDSVQQLSPWLKPGKTVAVLGSSGVGKSTLINTLSGDTVQMTQGIRENDAKGRHTTTSRALLPLASGSLILDTPGMRELQLADCAEGISKTFADIDTLAMGCRYADCHHEDEPGCRVLEAIQEGTLAQRRLENYQKLQREERLNSATLAQRRASDKTFGKFIKRTQGEAKTLKGR